MIDPVAYQTFELSPLAPKYRPTTHVRVAEGVHCFGQEFLGFPPDEGVSAFAKSETTSVSLAQGNASALASGVERGMGIGVDNSSPPAKIPGVGTRMTVLRLGNGEVGWGTGRWGTGGEGGGDLGEDGAGRRYRSLSQSCGENFRFILVSEDFVNRRKISSCCL